ncbi:MAG: SHOCT domain-containing protein [Acidimicrobiia bacterium]|nr:SHOCT domain-containing protein [Acidimicrobiia bacterium]
MRRIDLSRRDLYRIVSPPTGAALRPQDAWIMLLVDPVEQLKELADLRARGLLSAEEFESQKAQILRGG